MNCQIKLRNNLFCKGLKVIDGICERHRTFKLDEYNLDELTLCSKCGSFTQHARTCLVCNNTQCKALDKNENFCRSFTENNHEFCERHIQVGLDKLTNDELNALERCKICRNKYKLNGKCLVCEKKLCKALNQKGEKCPFSVFEDHNFCKTHQELYGHYTDDEFSKLVKCHGMCKIYFLPKENENYLTCPKCRDRGKQNREQLKETFSFCHAIISTTNLKCTNKVIDDYNYCGIHLDAFLIQEEEKQGIFRCKSKYSCNKILPANYKDTWCKTCRDKINKYNKETKKNQPYRQTVQFQVASNLRTRLKDALKSQNLFKTSGTGELLGCSYDFLKNYLENKFLEGMKWEYYGNNKLNTTCDICGGNRTGIHIDHIEPLASYDLENEEEQKQAFHYTNLQPMWNCCNLKKSNK